MSPKLFLLGIETFSTVLSHFLWCTGYYSLNLFKWAFFQTKEHPGPCLAIEIEWSCMLNVILLLKLRKKYQRLFQFITKSSEFMHKKHCNQSSNTLLLLMKFSRLSFVNIFNFLQFCTVIAIKVLLLCVRFKPQK